MEKETLNRILSIDDLDEITYLDDKESEMIAGGAKADCFPSPGTTYPVNFGGLASGTTEEDVSVLGFKNKGGVISFCASDENAGKTFPQ